MKEQNIKVNSYVNIYVYKYSQYIIEMFAFQLIFVSIFSCVPDRYMCDSQSKVSKLFVVCLK